MRQVETILDGFTPNATPKPVVTSDANLDEVPQDSLLRCRLLAEREFLSVLLYDPTESSAVLREQHEDLPRPADFVDSSSASIAQTIFPALLAGTPCSMQDTLSQLDEPARMLASSLFFDGQRMCEEAGSVMLAVVSTLNAFSEILRNQTMDNKVRQVKKVVDPTKRAEAAQEALESMRQQKTIGSTS